MKKEMAVNVNKNLLYSDFDDSLRLASSYFMRKRFLTVLLSTLHKKKRFVKKHLCDICSQRLLIDAAARYRRVRDTVLSPEQADDFFKIRNRFLILQMGLAITETE